MTCMVIQDNKICGNHTKQGYLSCKIHHGSELEYRKIRRISNKSGEEITIHPRTTFEDNEINVFPIDEKELDKSL